MTDTPPFRTDKELADYFQNLSEIKDKVIAESRAEQALLVAGAYLDAALVLKDCAIGPEGVYISPEGMYNKVIARTPADAKAAMERLLTDEHSKWGPETEHFKLLLAERDATIERLQAELADLKSEREIEHNTLKSIGFELVNDHPSDRDYGPRWSNALAAKLQTELGRLGNEHVVAMSQILDLQTQLKELEGIDKVCDHSNETIGLLQADVERLQNLINTPELIDFVAAVKIEAVHQRERWGSEHDEGKTAADWFWLIGYLAGKAIQADKIGDTDKLRHHIITTAAACANWHAQVQGTCDMRPGIIPPSGEQP